jgi:hypothetical protein
LIILQAVSGKLARIFRTVPLPTPINFDRRVFW